MKDKTKKVKQTPKTRVNILIEFTVNQAEGVHLSPEKIQDWIDMEFLDPRDFNITISKSSDLDFDF